MLKSGRSTIYTRKTTSIERNIQKVLAPVKLRQVKQYWLSQLNLRHINPTRSPTKSFRLIRNQPSSGRFRRKSCECDNCGQQTDKENRLAASHPQQIILQQQKERILQEAEQAGIIVRIKMKRQTQTFLGERLKLLSPPSINLGAFKYQFQDQCSAIRSGSITSIRLITNDLDSPVFKSGIEHLPESVVCGVTNIQDNPNRFKKRTESKDDINVKYCSIVPFQGSKKATIIKKSRYSQIKQFKYGRHSLQCNAQASSKASSIEQTSASNSQQNLQSQQLIEESYISQTHRVRFMSVSKTVQRYVAGVKLPQLKPYDSQRSLQKQQSTVSVSKFRTQNAMQEMKKSSFCRGEEKITSVYLSKQTPRRAGW